MIIVSNKADLAAIRAQVKDQQIGFVPTMGNLHEGHASLYRRARAENDYVVASLFVNPTQFNDPQDFEAYPSTIEQDQILLESLGVDLLFLPSPAMLYPDHYEMQVHETHLSEALEGLMRPGHFTGMLTVVLKLLNLVSPTRAYFGEKDYQQYLLVRKMVDAFFLPVDILPCETIRAADGVALSSRNSRLSPDARQKAAQFARLLQAGGKLSTMKQALEQAGIEVEYLAEQWGRRLGAVRVGGVRLIDNVRIEGSTE